MKVPKKCHAILRNISIVLMETCQERKTELRKVIYENIITSRTRKEKNELLRKKCDELKSNGLRKQKSYKQIQEKCTSTDLLLP